MALTDTEAGILRLADTPYAYLGAKEAAAREQFGLTLAALMQQARVVAARADAQEAMPAECRRLNDLAVRRGGWRGRDAMGEPVWPG